MSLASLRRSASRRKARLLMVGDGPERPKAEWLASTHGVADDVIFVGKQNDMSQFLAVSDVLLLPSELESFGLVALEAMACEVPVIATRVGGIPEVVRDGVDGFLYDVGDVRSMADGCLHILTRPSCAGDHGSSCTRARHRKSSPPARSCCKYEDLIPPHHRIKLAPAAKAPTSRLPI